MVLGIDEDAADEISKVIVALIEKRIGKEIVYMNHAAVGSGLVFADIGRLHHLVVAGEFKHICMHHEYQRVTCETYLKLKIATVNEFEPHLLPFNIVFLLKDCEQFFGSTAKEFETILGGGEDTLLEFSLGKDKIA